MRGLILLLACAVGACAPSPGPTPTPSASPAPTRTPAATLADLTGAHGWTSEDGPALEAALNADAVRILKPMSREQTIDAFAAAGYECQYGEASDDYPDPMQVCTRSFATPECQMDWELSTTADKGMTQEVAASFRRDCVGVDRDYPDKKASAMDGNLAPPSLPSASPAPGTPAAH